jgi:glycosyltransferase involved in cell wall biosynthesis
MIEMLPKRDFVPGRLTIVTATYNADAVLARCIESVLAQDYPDIEHVFIDGGSSDGTIDILKQYSAKIASWVSEKDKGIYDAWNKGLRIATGEWIAFLGADDQYVPGAVSQYMASLVRWVPEPPRKAKIIGQGWKWSVFQKEMKPAHVGSLHHRSLFETYGVYDISYRIVGDYELLLRPRGNLKASFMNSITAVMQAGGTSDGFPALTETRRAKIETGRRSPFLCMVELWIKQMKLALFRLEAKARS